MAKSELSQALSALWALVYRSTQVRYLDQDQMAKLQAALNVVSAGTGDEYFDRRAAYLRDCVRMSGILSVPSRKPTGTEEILEDCQRLQRYLETASCPVSP